MKAQAMKVKVTMLRTVTGQDVNQSGSSEPAKKYLKDVSYEVSEELASNFYAMSPPAAEPGGKKEKVSSEEASKKGEKALKGAPENK